MPNSRRTFLKSTLGASAALAASAPDFTRATIVDDTARAPRQAPAASRSPRIRFAAIGLNHGHITGLVQTAIAGGGELVSVYAAEPDLLAGFQKRFPQAKAARSVQEILDDESIQLVASASIPVDRAPLGIQVMRHGKDFLVDKPGATTLEQLAEVRKVQAETRRLYTILFGRLESRVMQRATDLVKGGAIGDVVQTLGLGPHRVGENRPAWFYDRSRYGGVLCDLASHQCDYFLAITGSTRAEVVAAQVGNVHHPQHPGLEDFGDAMVRGDKGTGYMRVDWLSPNGLSTWGDSRLTVMGTDGYLEVRSNVDLVGRPGGNHLFLVDQKETRHIDTSQTQLAFAGRFVDDVLQRTETAIAQVDVFRAMELALQAQAKATHLPPMRG